MKIYSKLLLIITTIAVGSFAFGQQPNPAKDISSYPGVYSRITDHPGVITFFQKSDGKLYIKAEDNYGTRIIGLKEGYSAEDFKSLIKNSKSGLFCSLLSDGKGNVGMNIGVGVGAGLVSTSPITLPAALPLWLSLNALCREEIGLNKMAKANLLFVSQETTGGYSLGLSLTRQNYWRLYDIIEKHAQVEASAEGFKAYHIGGASSSR